MSEVQLFKFAHLPIRTLMVEDEPWWVATDVAKALGYRNGPDLTRRLDDDEVTTHYVRSNARGNPNLNIISEPGLYHAIMRSNSRVASIFRRWVTHDVLPTLRRTGEYRIRNEQMSKDISSLNKTDLLTHYSNTVERFSAIVKEAQVLHAESEAEAKRLLASVSSEPYKTVTDIAKEMEAAGLFKGNGIALFKVLDQWGWVTSVMIGPAKKRVALEQSIKDGYMAMVNTGYYLSNGTYKGQTACRVTPAGKLAIMDRLRDEPQPLKIKDLQK